MGIKDITSGLFKKEYKVVEIKENDYGRLRGKTKSLRWGEDFGIVCNNKEQIPYVKKCLAYLDAMPSDMEARLRKYLFRYYKWYEHYRD